MAALLGMETQKTVALFSSCFLTGREQIARVPSGSTIDCQLHCSLPALSSMDQRSALRQHH
eukprot:1139858-Pelagomonas_calceolata.AAC.7